MKENANLATTPREPESPSHRAGRPRLVAFGLAVFVLLTAWAALLILQATNRPPTDGRDPMGGGVMTTPDEAPMNSQATETFDTDRFVETPERRDDANQESASSRIRQRQATDMDREPVRLQQPDGPRQSDEQTEPVTGPSL